MQTKINLILGGTRVNGDFYNSELNRAIILEDTHEFLFAL